MADLGSFVKILTGLGAAYEGYKALKGDDGASTDGIGATKERPKEKIGEFSVGRGEVKSIEERVPEIVRLVRLGKRDPLVQLAVAKVINERCGSDWCIREKDHPGEIKAIFAWVRQQARYMSDPRGVDTFRSPRRTLFQYHGGDCDDLSAALCAMLAATLESVGFETKLRVVALKPNPPKAYSHILVLCGLPQRNPTKWVALDPSVGQPPGWYPKDRVSGHKDFDIPV